MRTTGWRAIMTGGSWVRDWAIPLTLLAVAEPGPECWGRRLGKGRGGDLRDRQDCRLAGAAHPPPLRPTALPLPPAPAGIQRDECGGSATEPRTEHHSEQWPLPGTGG